MICSTLQAISEIYKDMQKGENIKVSFEDDELILDLAEGGVTVDKWQLMPLHPMVGLVYDNYDSFTSNHVAETVMRNDHVMTNVLHWRGIITHYILYNIMCHGEALDQRWRPSVYIGHTP